MCSETTSTMMAPAAESIAPRRLAPGQSQIDLARSMDCRAASGRFHRIGNRRLNSLACRSFVGATHWRRGGFVSQSMLGFLALCVACGAQRAAPAPSQLIADRGDVEF